jgi:succinyl-diaminopimelate desuccinylase
MPDPIEVLADLVAIPSINPMGRDVDGPEYGEARVAEYVVDFLTRHGVGAERRQVQPGRDNVLACVRGSREAPSLLFETHMDTVRADHMEVAPFDPVQRDGRLYGRGSCDAKASLAAMLVTMAELSASHPPGDVWLCAAVDEEYTFGGAAHLVRSGFRVHHVLVGEPTGLQLVTAHKGAMRWRIVTRGRAAHSATPWEGKSAIYAMADVVAALRDYAEHLQAQPSHPRLGPRTLSVGTIEGGQTVNTVPDWCEVTVDRRVLPTESLADVEAGLVGWLTSRGLAQEAHREQILRDPAMEIADGAPWPRAVLATANAVQPTETRAVHYGTDASKFAAVGMAAVVLGPGDIAQAHTATEWVAVDEVRAAAAVYREVSRTSVPSGPASGG